MITTAKSFVEFVDNAMSGKEVIISDEERLDAVIAELNSMKIKQGEYLGDKVFLLTERHECFFNDSPPIVCEIPEDHEFNMVVFSTNLGLIGIKCLDNNDPDAYSKHTLLFSRVNSCIFTNKLL